MKNYIFAFLFCLNAFACFGQLAIRHPMLKPQNPDSLDIAYYSGKKNYLHTTLQVFGLNMTVWAFDRYILKGDYAYISMRTVKDNFRKGFIWDNDNMGTNMFFHPYHGNLYFNSARSNGFNFWHSGLYSIGGSAMWELFMECEYPSTNDIIATPVGGMALGEVLYRASDLLLDDRKTGYERVGREVAAFIVSPMRGLTRFINGDYKQKRRTSGRQFGIPDISIDVSVGIRSMQLREEYDIGTGAAATVGIEYGDRFDAENMLPYDYFSVRANLNLQEFQPILGHLNVIGRLYSFELKDNKDEFASLGFYQHFDYYDTEYLSWISRKTPYKFCTPASMGIGLVYKRKRTEKIDWDLYAHLNGVLLGASLSDYYFVDERNYNLASGFSNKLGVNFIYQKDLASASVFYEGFYLSTWKGYPQNIDWNNFDRKTLNAQGDKSRAFLHALSLRLDGKIWRQIYLTGIGSVYLRFTNYKYYDNVFSRTWEGRLMLTYKF